MRAGGEQVETYERVTQYVVSAVPEGLCMDSYAWDTTVEYRDRDLWAVRHLSSCLGSDGIWDREPSPSNRTTEWKATHRFPLDEALRLAHEAAPLMVINGITVPELLTKYGADR